MKVFFAKQALPTNHKLYDPQKEKGMRGLLLFPYPPLVPFTSAMKRLRQHLVD